MTNTPYHDLGSTDILSAYVSGLQHSVNKIETILNMKTQSAAGHAMQPVADQNDPSLRYIIYEGTLRNWLDSPSPVIYRNGSAVSTSEYKVSPAYGVVVFNSQQAPTDTITADFDYVIAGSNFNDALSGLSPLLHYPGYWRSHGTVAADVATGVLIAANLFDAFPFPVTETTTYDKIGIKVDTAGASGTSARLGVYKDNGSQYPGGLLVDAGTVPTDATGVQTLPINLTLERGIYWLARNSDGGPGITGINNQDSISIGIDDTLSGSPAGAIRSTTTYGSFPSTYSSGAAPLFRGAYASVWIRKA